VTKTGKESLAVFSKMKHDIENPPDPLDQLRYLKVTLFFSSVFTSISLAVLGMVLVKQWNTC